MIRPAVAFAMLLLTSHAMAAGTALPVAEPTVQERLDHLLLAQRRSCKAVSSCREAVEMWCGGYTRADADKDGIPCENVCSSKAEVDKIRAEIGC